MKWTVVLIGLGVVFSIVGCTEAEQVSTKETPAIEEKKLIQLTSEQKVYVKKTLQNFDSLYNEVCQVPMEDGAKVRQTNIMLNDIPDFPSWFSSSTREERLLNLVKAMLQDLGTGLAIKRVDVIKLAKEDYEKLSLELKTLLKEN